MQNISTKVGKKAKKANIHSTVCLSIGRGRNTHASTEEQEDSYKGRKKLKRLPSILLYIEPSTPYKERKSLISFKD